MENTHLSARHAVREDGKIPIVSEGTKKNSRDEI